MKFYKIILCIFVTTLFGCTRIEDDINSRLNGKLELVKEQEAHRPVFDHKYYSYYREPSVGRIDDDASSNTFVCYSETFVMNLNISAIVNKEYYSNNTKTKYGLVDSRPIAQNIGVYTDYQDVEHSYNVNVYSTDDKAVIIFNSDYMIFYSVCSVNSVPNVAATMLKIARSVKVDEQLILTTYTNLTSISNTKKTLDLFQNNVPESGVIDELFVEHIQGVNSETGWNSISGDMSMDGSVSTSAPIQTNDTINFESDAVNNDSITEDEDTDENVVEEEVIDSLSSEDSENNETTSSTIETESVEDDNISDQNVDSDSEDDSNEG